MEKFRINYWQQNPLIRIIIPFTAGILTAGKTATFTNFHLLVLISCIIIYTVSSLFYYRYINYKFRWIHGVPLMVFMYTAGYTLFSLSHYNFRNDFFMKNFNEKSLLLIEIRTTKENNKGDTKAEANVLSMHDGRQWQNVSGKLMLTIPKDTTIEICQYTFGSRWIVNCAPREIKASTNPGDFDYKDFLARKGIYHQAKINKTMSLFYGERNFSPRVRAIKIREKLLNIFSELGLQGKELAVTSALVLGFTDDLDTETRKQYSAAGAMHILAVSGMHVGMVFLVLNFLISLTGKRNKEKKISTLMLLFGIWFYAMLTGLAPSVFRAAAMLSFVTASKAFSRKASSYNTLCASALLILIADPQTISHIGFQLSFTAVLGIILFYEPISKLLFIKQRYIRKIWELIAVSLSAQISTGPLTLLYFGQFPNYFILTNLIATPLSSLVIYSAIATLVLSPLSLVGTIMIKILHFLVKSLNFSLAYIEGLPYSVTTNIHISSIQCLLLAGCIISVYIFSRTRIKVYLTIAGMTILFFFSISLFRDISTNNKNRIIIFDNYAGSAIGFYKGSRGVIILDSLLISKSQTSSMPVSWGKAFPGIKEVIAIPSHTHSIRALNGELIKEGPFIYFSGRSFFIINKELSAHKKFKKPVNVDYLIVTKHRQTTRPYKALNILKPGKVITDGTIQQWYDKQWQQTCNDRETEYYSVKQNGAWISLF